MTADCPIAEPPRRLHLAVYPDHAVPHWLAARIAFDADGEGAALELRPGLSARQQLRALAWAGGALPSHLDVDGLRFAASFTADDGRLYGPVMTVTEIGTPA
jgi:hypothetical protein